MTDRERFEEWAGSLVSFCPDIKRKGYSYESLVTAAAWHGWQASRKQALEEARAECLDLIEDWPSLTMDDVLRNVAVRACVEAIDRLANPEGEQG